MNISVDDADKQILCLNDVAFCFSFLFAFVFVSIENESMETSFKRGRYDNGQMISIPTLVVIINTHIFSANSSILFSKIATIHDFFLANLSFFADSFIDCWMFKSPLVYVLPFWRMIFFFTHHYVPSGVCFKLIHFMNVGKLFNLFRFQFLFVITASEWRTAIADLQFTDLYVIRMMFVCVPDSGFNSLSQVRSGWLVGLSWYGIYYYHSIHCIWWTNTNDSKKKTKSSTILGSRLSTCELWQLWKSAENYDFSLYVVAVASVYV